jgi:outer membrane immunogenic protein
VKRLTFFLATAAFVAPLNFANAADIEVTAHDWSGPYIGLLGGYAMVDHDVATNIANFGVFNINQSFEADGPQLGLEAGWNHQSGSLVFGLAADISLVDNESLSLVDVVNLDEIYVAKQGFVGTFRGKLGYSFDSVLLYATGGLAVTDAEFRFENYTDASRTVLESISKDTDTLVGFTVGGGLEFAVTESISIKGEYLYADFGKLDFAYTPGALFGKADLTSHTARAGVSWSF